MKNSWTRLQALLKRPLVKRIFLIAALATLTGTTLLWSLLGARLEQSNADQLVNAYLFKDATTAHGAVLPAAHSQLIKWPLFYLIKLLNFSSGSFVLATVIAACITIGLLALILSRIEKRPMVLGTIYLALASVLLLVPAQPYPGGLLPVSLSMLTTRNVEYILFILGFALVIRARRLRDWQFIAGSLCVVLLFASDRLFLYLALGASLIALSCYIIRRRWTLVTDFNRVFLASLAASLLALAVISLVNWAGWTHIGSGTSSAPFGLNRGGHGLALGLLYALGGLLTNLGANPAYNALTLHQVPQKLSHNFISVAGPAYVINLAIVAVGLVIGLRYLARSLGNKKSKLVPQNTANLLTIFLLWALITAIILFVITDHYYVADARYLSISLFAVFIAIASWFRTKRIQLVTLLKLLPFLIISLVCGVLSHLQTHHQQSAAYDQLNQRNKSVSQALESHHTNFLVGDYWRVLPIKLISHNKANVLPLGNCTSPRQDLISQVWQPDLRHHRFAYLLTLDNANLTNFPTCSLKQVVQHYGLPNSSALIAGNLSHPKELVLFYDGGIRRSSPRINTANNQPATVVPVNLDQLVNISCKGPTVMNVVAHQDDDLLFMSPDLIHDVNAGHCVRSVYLTAGDAGSGASYWLEREAGSEAAYSEMLNTSAIWVNRIVKLPEGQFINVANPRGDSKHSLIFMHLPDGNLHGEGFAASGHQSLSKLQSGKISEIETVDHQSKYSIDQLTSGLAALMQTYVPSEIRTQSNDADDHYPDHSDHRVTGQFTAQAYNRFEQLQYEGKVIVPLEFYMGYPIHNLPQNVDGKDLLDKEAAYLSYAAFDKSACNSIESCQKHSTFGIYLQRQYRNSN